MVPPRALGGEVQTTIGPIPLWGLWDCRQAWDFGSPGWWVLEAVGTAKGTPVYHLMSPPQVGILFWVYISFKLVLRK